eukprot:scaffold61755_cov45-Attheya_sp.AAC.3
MGKSPRTCCASASSFSSNSSHHSALAVVAPASCVISVLITGPVRRQTDCLRRTPFARAEKAWLDGRQPELTNAAVTTVVNKGVILFLVQTKFHVPADYDVVSTVLVSDVLGLNTIGSDSCVHIITP